MYDVGIDLGGTGIKAGVVSREGTLLNKAVIPTNSAGHFTEIVRDMAETAIEAIKLSGLELKDIDNIGIGSPGTISKTDGVIIYANNINFRNTPIRNEMRKYINKPVFLENDANCAALGESIAGAARGVNISVTVTLGTGIGGGVIINGKIFSGFNYSGSELGHMVIVSGGERCSCGRLGCWESYASATALIRETKEALERQPFSIIRDLIEGDTSRINAKTAFDAAKLGDPTALDIVRQYIIYLGEGIVNVINIFQPEVVVIGGGISNEGEYLLQPLREFVEANRYTRKEVPTARIVKAELGNDAGIIGASFLDD